MMYIRLLLAALFFLPVAASAQERITNLLDANKKLEMAHLAYERGDSRDALDYYLQVAQSEFGGPAAWFNAGNASYRSGDTGHAVLYYKRALKMDPDYERAIRSLDFISPATNESDSLFTDEVVGTVFRKTTPAFWVIIAEVCFVLIWISVARAMAIPDRDRRGHWIAAMGWALVFFLASGYLAYANHEFRAGGNQAVVVSDKTITRSAPDETATAVLELPAGTIVDLSEQPRKGFVRVRLADGRAGFVETDTIERI